MASKKEKMEVKLNADEIKIHLKHLINNNRHIQAQGKVPIGLNIEGEAGLGKTSIVIQLANEMDQLQTEEEIKNNVPKKKMQCVKRNLAEIEELGDLVGFPLRQFQMCKGEGEAKECLWIDEHAVNEYTKQGYSFTGKKQMSYAPPEWVSESSGGILFLDDFSRADSRMIQAAMEIINRQQYISWKLPKDWHIIMSSNPDNGHYMVNSQDMAHQSRYSTIIMKWDVECWARQAEKEQIDGRCINFLLQSPEIMKDENLKEGINPRSITNFFNSISSFDDFEKHLPMIQQIGESSVGHDVTTLFTTFINNRLDKIISPKDILSKDWKFVKGELEAICGTNTNGTYRPDIASIITTRIINWGLYYAEKNPVDQKMIDRIIAITTDKDLLAVDLKFIIIKEFLNKNKKKFQKLMLNEGIIKMSAK